MSRKRAWPGYGAAVPLMFVIASCTAVPTPEAPPSAPPAPVPAPAAPPAKPWMERALDAGGWRYDAASRTAAFVQPGNSAPLMTMACSGTGIRLTAGLGATGQPLDVALKTTAGTDQLRFDGGDTTIPSRDGRLDRIAFSRGRFAMEASNGSTLTLPVQSEIGRVIEDCRG